MAVTKIADVIVPEVFNAYIREQSVAKNALIQCGIMSNDPVLDALAEKGGRSINMPFWKDLSGDDEVLSDSGSLTPTKIESGQDLATLLMRGHAWGVNDLATALSGDDPMKAIGDMVVNWWNVKKQKVLISTLTGAFSGTGMENKVLDISAVVDADKITGETFLDAAQLMGDAKDDITGVIMHSATETQLRKNNLIETMLDSDNQKIRLFMGKNVIIDDTCPHADGIYTTYLFGAGAVGYGRGVAPVETETDRDSLAGEDILVNRQHFIMHPRGIKFTNTSVVGASPTNTELATGTNWEKVYDDKNIRIVKFVHKL